MEATALAVLFALTTCGLAYLLVKEKLRQREESKAKGSNEVDQAAQIRRIEDKMDVYDPITRSDTARLREVGSDRLNDAIALRRQQISEGNHPEAPRHKGRPRRRRR